MGKKVSVESGRLRISFKVAVDVLKLFSVGDDSMSKSGCCWESWVFPEGRLMSASITFSTHEGGLIYN